MTERNDNDSDEYLLAEQYDSDEADDIAIEALGAERASILEDIRDGENEEDSNLSPYSDEFIRQCQESLQKESMEQLMADLNKYRKVNVFSP